MKKYIIITRRVSSMGGAQLFVLRRCLHLVNQGFDVHVVVANHSEEYFPLKDKFCNIPIYVIPETERRIVQVSFKKQTVLINDILNKVGEGESIAVESHNLNAVEWGELLSAKCKARHLAYLLDAQPISAYKFQPGLRIFKEKLDKGEFFGCSSVSLPKIFGRDNVPSNYVNVGYDENEMKEHSVPTINYIKQQGDYVITTITRFDKTYIEPLADAVAELAHKYENQRFVLLLVGSCPNKKRVDYLINNYNNERYNQSNLDIQYLGYIDVLGKDIFDLSDVFVGMGTASINAISQRCITINIDPREGMTKASGFFGVDTNNFGYSESGILYSIFTKLEEAFLLNQQQIVSLKNVGRTLFEKEFEVNSCFEKMDMVINSISPVRDRHSLSIPSYYRLLCRCIIRLKRLISRPCYSRNLLSINKIN